MKPKIGDKEKTLKPFATTLKKYADQMCVLAGVLRSVLPSTLLMCNQVLPLETSLTAQSRNLLPVTKVIQLNTILLLATNFYICYS